MAKFNSLQLKPPQNDALPRSERLKADNPGYESKTSARFADKLRTGDIPTDVPHFTDKAKYIAEVKKFVDGGGATKDIKSKVGILVGTGHDGNPTYQQMQQRGGLKLRSSREKVNTELNRQLNTNLSNPDPVSRAQTDKVMKQVGGGKIAADHDHSLTRVGNALDNMTEQRRQQYRNNFEQSGQRAGHYPENIKPLDSVTNRAKENGPLKVENGKYSGGYTRLDKDLLGPQEAKRPSLTIKQLDKTGTTSRAGRQQLALASRKLPGLPTPKAPLDFRGVMPWMDYVGPIDQMTGGHLESTLDKGVNLLRNSLGIKSNPVGHHPTPDPLVAVRNTVARSIWDLGNKMFGQNDHYPIDIQ